MIQFKALMEKVQQAKDTGYPFVVYRKPGDNLIHGIIQKDKQLELANDYEGSGFIMAPFQKSERAVLISESNSQLYSSAIENIQREVNASLISTNSYISSSDEKEAHLDLVRKGKAYIKDSRLLKVVLSRKETYPLEDFKQQIILEKLLSTYPSAFIYIWFHPDVGYWAGASPETLLRTKGLVFRTMSLAGTQKFKGTSDVHWNEKEINEQQMVTDHIVEALAGSNYVVGQTYTKKAGDLLHICTEIGGKLNEKDRLTDLIEKLHPTAAVCGFPKGEAQDFIDTHEGYSRSFYTGFLGELNLGSKDQKDAPDERKTNCHSNLFVNLRCMQIEEGNEIKAFLYIGGGITEASDPEAEWEETVEKSLVMKAVLEK